MNLIFKGLYAFFIFFFLEHKSMDLIKNNFISGDLLKYSISSLESRYNALSRERMDLQIQISKKMGRIAFLDILPRNYEILEFTDYVEVQEL
jgi:hypothetical protein